MAKLSDAQTNALTGLIDNGAFPKGTRQATIDKLFSLHMVKQEGSDAGNIVATDAGYSAIGRPSAAAPTDEPLADWERELLGIDPAKPFTVQILVNDKWLTLWEMNAATWGTANVRRNRLKSNGQTVRVYNAVDYRVWA